ncbi:MAG: hypothetical protein KBB14_02530 [Thermoanaerobaculia bacterium]|nr:hypothetical protein [Thermoanaerobaculia bacterium]
MAWVASFFLVGFLVGFVAGALRAGFGSGSGAGALRASAAGFAASALRAVAFRVSRRFGAFAPGIATAAGSVRRAGTASGALFGVLGPAFVFRGPGPSFSFFRFDFSSMVLVPFGS